MGEQDPIEQTPEKLRETIDDLMTVIGRLQDLNDQRRIGDINVPNPVRSRELSLAITNLETGLLWARQAWANLS